MAAGAARLQAAPCRSLCYDKHHGWMVIVVVPLPDILPCVLRAGMGPLGKGSSSPEFWRKIQRYLDLATLVRTTHRNQPQEDAMSKKVLIIVSNAYVIGPHNRRTGNFLPEVAHPYAAFDRAQYQIDFASLTGDTP